MIKLLSSIFTLILLYVICNSGQLKYKQYFVEIPRIDFIEMSNVQPQALSSDIIWFDDFSVQKEYLESVIDSNINSAQI